MPTDRVERAAPRALLLPRTRRLFAGFLLLALGVQVLELVDADTAWWPDRGVALVAIAAYVGWTVAVNRAGRVTPLGDVLVIVSLTAIGLGLGRNGAVLVTVLATVPLRALHGRPRGLALTVVGVLAAYGAITFVHHGVQDLVGHLGFVIVTAALVAFAATLRRLGELLAEHDLRAQLGAVATETAAQLVAATDQTCVDALEVAALAAIRDRVARAERDRATAPLPATDVPDRLPELPPTGGERDPVAEVLRRLVVDVHQARQRIASEARYRTIAESSHDGVYLRAAGRPTSYRYLNPAASAILGVSRAELEADPARARALVHEDDVPRLRDRLDDRGVLIGTVEVRCRRPDGELRWVALKERIVDPSGSVATVLGTVRDVTAQRRTQAALERVASRERAAADELRHLDAMKSTFLQAVSHELRTPLSAVIGAAQTLGARDELMTAEQRRRMLEMVQRQSSRLERLLTDLLDVDRLSRGLVAPERRPTDVRALVEVVVGTLDAPAPDVTVVGGPVVVAVDAPKVERIVDNLLRNAVRHTPPGTPIVCTVASVDGGVHITVEDEGPGVPDELKDELFAPFAQGPSAGTAASPGTGIGLALVRALAELHDGRSWVEDRPGGGARFGVWLAGAASEAVAAPLAVATPGAAGSLPAVVTADR